MGWAILLFNLLVMDIEAAPLLTADISREKCVTQLVPAQKAIKAGKPEDIMRALYGMKSKDGELLFSKNDTDLKKNIQTYFGAPSDSISRLEQFYALLYSIGMALKDRADELELDIRTSQQVLRVSKVFPTPEFIESLIEATADYHPRKGLVKWTIKLDQPEMHIPLNGNNGYLTFQHGFCQKVQKVWLYGGFEADISKNIDQNIFVKFSEPIDFEGSFGSRGIAHINIKYASLYDIEFLHGSKIGVARVKIAAREFETTDHGWFLRWVSSILSQKTAQRIDW